MLESCGHGSAKQINRASFTRATEELTRTIASVRPELDELNRLPPPGEDEPSEVAPQEAQRRLDGLLGGIIACTGADKGNIQVYEPAERILRIRAQAGFSPSFLRHFAVVRAEQAACGLALHLQGTVLVSDVARSPVFDAATREVILQENIRALQSTALSCDRAHRVGVVSVHYRTPGVPIEGQDLLRRFAPRLAEVVALWLPAAG